MTRKKIYRIYIMENTRLTIPYMRSYPRECDHAIVSRIFPLDFNSEEMALKTLDEYKSLNIEECDPNIFKYPVTYPNLSECFIGKRSTHRRIFVC